MVTSSNGALTLGITGTLAQVNADLATLTYTGAATGSDTISVNSTDSLGNADAHMIPVIVVPSGPTSVTVPGPGGAPETLEFGSPALAAIATTLLAAITPANALFVPAPGAASLSAP